MSPTHKISRRGILAGSLGMAAVGGLASPALATGKPGNKGDGKDKGHCPEDSHRMLLNAHFGGHRLDRDLWNPWITDVPSKGIPWFYRPELGQPNSAMGGPGGNTDEYDLASNVVVRQGALHLKLTPGSPVDGYTHTGAAVQTLPSRGDYGDGVTRTRGFTFVDARVEIVAKMPDSSAGGWGSIWFLNADPRTAGNWEFDLVETGMQNWNGTVPANTASSTFHPEGSKVQTKDLDLGEPIDARFHTWALEYRRGKFLRSYVDGRPILEVTQNVPSVPYFLMISNQIASPATDGWHTQPDPTKAPISTDLVVRSVKAWRL